MGAPHFLFLEDCSLKKISGDGNIREVLTTSVGRVQKD
jgi:hypothetical protein